MHAYHTCFLTDSKHIGQFLTFPVWLHVAMEQIVLQRKLNPCLAVSLKSDWSKHQGVPLQFCWALKEAWYNQIGGGFEESACCLQETDLIMAV